jgi:hypothetical protein
MPGKAPCWGEKDRFFAVAKEEVFQGSRPSGLFDSAWVGFPLTLLEVIRCTALF